jgi:RES domain-containing protein
MIALPADRPDELVETLPAPRWPRNWRDFPPPPETQALGSRWLEAGRALALRVPSVVIPSERNLLLNPRHEGFRRAKISPGDLFSFDPRMWTRRA